MRLLVASLLLGVVRSQHFIQPGNNHPAAGPDLTVHLARSLPIDDVMLSENYEGRPDALVGPEGREFFAPLKEQQLKHEYELLREADEIARVLGKPALSAQVSLSTWLWSLVGCSLVASCGILPAFLLPANSSEYLHTREGKRSLNLLLSFAVGGLLGDVFLHLLPETWSSMQVDHDQIGFWTLAGLLVCFVVEKLCASTEESQHRVCAIMNLIANLVDNFTHGLAVGASFLVSTKFGFMTTFAILVHEIPHEISDFAILLRADYNRAEAAKAQLFTAFGGVLGACAALVLRGDSVGAAEWVLPFTAGGFINIALAQILPELNEETDRRQNLKQLGMILLGLTVMAVLNQSILL